MKSFKRYLEDQNESPMPGGENPLTGSPGGGEISSAPGGLPSSNSPMSGPEMPMGGPNMSPDMAANPMGSVGQSNQNAPLKLKAYNVWDVLEKILN